ncbi:MAG TPA: hypothetical protein VHK91_03325 [Flavisolibacter sp.]|jgi:hypothetical protein|nr:hypothetical protein [Flavisolibacter sp.]
MKAFSYIAFGIVAALALASCEKREYDKGGLEEFSNHYYAAYIPNNNSQVSVTRTQTALLKFPVQFYSSYVRDYDAVANYAVVTTGIPNPAALGVDFNVVDKNGNAIQPVNGLFSITFPQAKYAMDTIYVKLLNNPAPGTRKMEIQIVENKTDKYYVDIFSTAFRRPVEIK